MAGEYHVQKGVVLGKGGFAVVHRGVHLATGHHVGVKVLPISKRAEAENEVRLQMSFDHPNVLKISRAWTDDVSSLFIVLELGGGDLSDRLQQGRPMPTRTWATDVLRAVAYVHSRGISHNDVKCENFLICGEALKIMDFGLATNCGPEDHLGEAFGTRPYWAPELLMLEGSLHCEALPHPLRLALAPRGPSHAADIWSAGIVIYSLLFGKLPPWVNGAVDKLLAKEVMSNVRQGNFLYHQPCRQDISQDAKDLIDSLLQLTPGDRLTGQRALSHRWIADVAQGASKASLEPRVAEGSSGYYQFRGDTAMDETSEKQAEGSKGYGQIKSDTAMSETLEEQAEGSYDQIKSDTAMYVTPEKQAEGSKGYDQFKVNAAMDVTPEKQAEGLKVYDQLKGDAAVGEALEKPVRLGYKSGLLNKTVIIQNVKDPKLKSLELNGQSGVVVGFDRCHGRARVLLVDGSERTFKATQLQVKDDMQHPTNLAMDSPLDKRELQLRASNAFKEEVKILEVTNVGLKRKLQDSEAKLQESETDRKVLRKRVSDLEQDLRRAASEKVACVLKMADLEAKIHAGFP